jgi:hypothetical protein
MRSKVYTTMKGLYTEQGLQEKEKTVCSARSVTDRKSVSVPEHVQAQNKIPTVTDTGPDMGNGN